MSPKDLLYAPTHEWVALSTDDQGRKIATLGISAFAVQQLTDLVFIDLPEVGETLKAGETFGEIESVKAVSDLYSPVDGEITAVNDALADKLEILSTDPYQAGWMVKVRLTNEAGLSKMLSYDAYQKQCAEEGH